MRHLLQDYGFVEYIDAMSSMRLMEISEVRICRNSCYRSHLMELARLSQRWHLSMAIRGNKMDDKFHDGDFLLQDRTWLAHERTLMAWVRTATSMISFSFKSPNSSLSRGFLGMRGINRATVF
jgi:hypothetical protein